VFGLEGIAQSLLLGAGDTNVAIVAVLLSLVAPLIRRSAANKAMPNSRNSVSGERMTRESEASMVLASGLGQPLPAEVREHFYCVDQG